MEEQCFYQNVQSVVVKNQNLSKSKKLLFQEHKINEKENKFLLEGDEFMPEIIYPENLSKI